MKYTDTEMLDWLTKGSDNWVTFREDVQRWHAGQYVVGDHLIKTGQIAA